MVERNYPRHSDVVSDVLVARWESDIDVHLCDRNATANTDTAVAAACRYGVSCNLMADAFPGKRYVVPVPVLVEASSVEIDLGADVNPLEVHIARCEGQAIPAW